jgi:hypothetical protein
MSGYPETPRRSSRSRTIRVRQDEVIPLTESSRVAPQRQIGSDSGLLEGGTEPEAIDPEAFESPDTNEGPSSSFHVPFHFSYLELGPSAPMPLDSPTLNNEGMSSFIFLSHWLVLQLNPTI